MAITKNFEILYYKSNLRVLQILYLFFKHHNLTEYF